MKPTPVALPLYQHRPTNSQIRTTASRKTRFIYLVSVCKYRPLLFLVLSIFGLILPFAPLPPGLSATPPSGTLTNVSGPVTYTAGPFFIPNATAQASGTPICTLPQSCDDFTLTVAVTPPITTATHKVKVVVGWPVAAADFDVYILQGNTLVTTAASSSDPEVAFFAPINGVYTIRVAPFAPAGQSFNATISLEPIPAPPLPPPGIAPRYKNYPDTSGFGNEAGEPSIGVDWNPNVASLKHDQVNMGGAAFFTANFNELRVSFDDCSSPAADLWEDKTSPQTSAGGLDPIGFVDHYGAAPTPGRVFQSQLAAAAGSILAFSDDDGETWTPSQGAGQPAGVDHQTVGGGPYNPNSIPPPPLHPTYPNAIYYASQDAATAFIARSDNGGLTFGLGIPMWNLTQCGGLHGHIKVAGDGTVYVPNKGCGGQQGVAVSTDNGLTWVIRTVPGSTPGDTDPSLGIGTDNTIYIGYQNGDGHPHIARSTDQGQTWVDRDAGGGFIQNCVFPEVVAGDGDRAAFGFLGTPTGGNYQDAANFHGIWHFYIATTYDRGLSYFLVDATPGDPVQIGSICTGGTTCGSDRNLLDFNDLTVDKEGRVLAAYADGCVAPGCQENPPSPSSSSRSAKATIIRQSGGRRLFAAFDPIEPAAPAAPRLISATRDISGVTVKWDEPDNSGSPLTGYKIHRGTSSGGETFLASIGPAAQRYLDTTANPNTPYFYRVTAVNTIGEGTFCREVQVTAAPPLPTRCAEPYISITTDPAGDQTGDPANTQLDIREIAIGEPFLNKCTNQLLFKMKVTDLTVVPPQARWTIFFTRANGTEYFVSMNSDSTGNPTGVVFNYGHTSIGPGGVRQLTTDGVADDGSAFSADGTIFILISNSKLTFNLTPPPATLPPPAPGDTFGNVNAITQQTVGVLLLTLDSTGSGSCTLAGNLSCQPNNPPLAVMSAMPTSGDAPLTVNFNGSASSDPDMCDSVVSYTFDFGDGSLPVTQASPMISHMYNSPGEYSAQMKVTDSHARLSDNTAIVTIEVEGVGTSMSGVISYCIDPSKRVPNAMVSTATGAPSASSMTDANGVYLLSGLGAGPYTVALSKPAEAPGIAITAFDAALVAQFVAGVIPAPNACQVLAGDASNSGALSALDAGLIAQTVAGIPNTGIAGTWKFVPPSRSYTTLPGDLANQNYDAVLVGDVSGNWPPAGPQGSAPSGPTSKFSIPVSLPDTKASQKSTNIMVPVIAGNTKGLNVVAYDFTFTFNPKVIELANPAFETNGTLSQGWSITANTSTPGQIRVVAFNSQPLSGSGTLIFIKFNVVGSAGSTCPLTWKKFPFNEGNPAAILTDGKFTVQQRQSVLRGSMLRVRREVVSQTRPEVSHYSYRTRFRGA